MTAKPQEGERVKVLRPPSGNFDGAAYVIAKDCPECGCNRAIHNALHAVGVHIVECAACEYTFHKG